LAFGSIEMGLATRDSYDIKLCDWAGNSVELGWLKGVDVGKECVLGQTGPRFFDLNFNIIVIFSLTSISLHVIQVSRPQDLKSWTNSNLECGRKQKY
jgi:hypothetical protein